MKGLARGVALVGLALLSIVGNAEERKEVVPDKDYDLPFPVGERLEYNITWGIISVAKSVATTEWIEEDGRILLRIEFRTKSNGYLKRIYPVNDTIESIVDPETLLPIRFTKNMSEGRYRAHEVTTFDFEEGMATWESKLSDKEKTYEINEETRDLVTFLYAMRRHDMKENEIVEEEVMADEKIYDLRIKTKEVERVKLKEYGKVDSLKLEPQAEFQGIFVHKGEMEMWVSRDERRIFTKLMIDTPFANVRLKLNSVEGGPDDDWWDPPEQEGE